MRWNSKVALLALGSFFIAVIIEQLNERRLGFAQLYQETWAEGLTWTLALGSLWVCLLVAFPGLLTRFVGGWIAPLLTFASLKAFDWFLRRGALPGIEPRDIEWILPLLYGLFFSTLIGAFAPLLYLFTVEKLRPRQARLIEKPNAHTVVVFVHGLGGDLEATWGNFPSLLQGDSDLAEVAIFLWGYPTALFRHVPDIWEAAKQLQTEIRIRLSKYKNVVLVGHSLGGLLIRAMVIDALKNGRRGDIKSIKHIVTFGTPNDGSQLASIASYFHLSNAHVEALGVTSKLVSELRGEWVNRVYAPNIEPGQELIKQKIPLTAVVGVEDTIVTPDSARSFFQNPPPESVPGDHTSMKLPQSSEDTCYILVKRVLSGPSEYPADEESSVGKTSRVILHPERPITAGSNLQTYAPIMKDFFISYTKADKAWAEWIAWTLEEAGLSVIIQAWDFRPGGNFVLDMQRAASGAEKTIVVLSPAYLQSEYTQPEWASAFAQDPQGTARKLIPVRIAKCEPTGMLAPIIYVDLLGLAQDDARAVLLGAFSERAKPSSMPAFPGAQSPYVSAAQPQPAYPGTTNATSTSTAKILVTLAESADQSLRLSASQRLQFIRQLNAILPQQFNMLLFAVNPEPGLVPPMPAPQGDRTSALLTWAEGPGGCGLSVLQKLLDTIVNPR
jgi:pimeloyl-ACP methyl ester carboxylesterase